MHVALARVRQLTNYCLYLLPLEGQAYVDSFGTSGCAPLGCHLSAPYLS